MAKRIRTHILEDESRIAFMQALPAEWVYRDKDKDYGIDCEVEIFEKDGTSTGIVFLVQLKATDSVNNSNNRKITFEASKINQFYSYELPVLVVRYMSAEKTIYVKWANEITIFDKSKKRIDLEFAEKNRWNEITSENIRRYLDKISVIKNRKLNFPIPTYISNESLALKKINPRILISNLRSAINQYDKFIVNCKSEENALLTIELYKNYILVNLNTLGKSRLIISLDNINLTDEYYSHLTKIILINIGVCLSQIGYNGLCNDLIFGADLFETVKKDENVFSHLLPSLLHSSYFNEVLMQIIDYSGQNKDRSNLVQITAHMLILFNRGKYNNKELETIEKFLLSEIKWAKDNGSETLLAVSYYNIGNHYRATSKFYIAINNYIQAKKYNEIYKHKSYYCHELGGLFFSIEKYYWAGLAYKKAINLGGKPKVKALYADTLMFQGYYEQACNYFNNYLNENKGEDNYEWYLKFICLLNLLDDGWDRTQRRNTDSAKKIVKEGKYKEALEKDFLLDLAWYNYGITLVEQKDYMKACISFTMAALLLPSDIEAWVNATGCCLVTNFTHQESFIINIINCAYHYNNEEYVNALLNNPNFQNLPANSPFEQLIDSVIAISRHNNEEKEIRIFDDLSGDEIPIS